MTWINIYTQLNNVISYHSGELLVLNWYIKQRFEVYFQKFDICCEKPKLCASAHFCSKTTNSVAQLKIPQLQKTVVHSYHIRCGTGHVSQDYKLSTQEMEMNIPYSQEECGTLWNEGKVSPMTRSLSWSWSTIQYCRCFRDCLGC